MSKIVYLNRLITTGVLFSSAMLLVVVTGFSGGQKHAAGWVALFDGKTLNGWKAGANAATFSVKDGQIVVHGPTAHLFYEGDYHGHEFKNFELKVDVMTYPGSNSGIYFDTEFQDSSWPKKGFEVQVNNSHTDWKRTGSLYNVVNVKEVFVKDNEWFTESVKVDGKHITVKLNDRTVVDYTEPAGFKPTAEEPGHYIASGTFALQGHDPKSEVHFKNVLVRVLD